MQKRICKKCGDDKELNEFITYKNAKKQIRYTYKCKECNRKLFNTYYKDIYYPNHKDLIDNKNKKYNKNHEDELKEYREEYRATNIVMINKKARDKRSIDIFYRLRSNISSNINQSIKKSLSSKNGSCLQFLPYTIQELKIHLEKLFEPWMTWENYGRYNSEWNDNDQNTWTWQIDHIIPQSDLRYVSMLENNFKKCWSLENLRPFSAKKNLVDGSSRIRHKDK